MTEKISQENFEKILNSLSKAVSSIDPNMLGYEFTEDHKKALSASIVDLMYNILPRQKDTYSEGKEFLDIVLSSMIETWGNMSDGDPALCYLASNMRTNYPVPKDSNDCEIIIHTVCGEVKTVEMTQEISSIEYMGKVLKKDSDGEFSI